MRNVTLRGVIQLRKEGSAIRADVKEVLALAGRTEQNTEAVLTNMERADLRIESMLVSSL